MLWLQDLVNLLPSTPTPISYLMGPHTLRSTPDSRLSVPLVILPVAIRLHRVVLCLSSKSSVVLVPRSLKTPKLEDREVLDIREQETDVGSELKKAL